MKEFSDAIEKLKEGLTEIVLQTCEEYPDITQPLLSQVTLVSQSQISKYINGEQPMPVTWVMALKDDARTRPLAMEIMKYMGGFTLRLEENFANTDDSQPMSHDLMNMDLSKAQFIRAVDDRKPVQARKALNEMKQIIWNLELKSLTGNLRRIKGQGK